MLFNVIVALLHNTKEDRWHPIFFYENPLPGPPSDDKPVRYKSKMHHTTGFETREEALASLEDPKFEAEFGGIKKCLDEDMPWDGEGIPALVRFFSEDGTKVLM